MLHYGIYLLLQSSNSAQKVSAYFRKQPRLFLK